jgi:hypothetical protein
MKDGTLKENLTSDLPRPISEDDPTFNQEVKKIRSSLE